MLLSIAGAYNIGEVLLLCLIGLVIVVLTLIVLILLLMGFSKLINSIGFKKSATPAAQADTEVSGEDEEIVAAVTAALLAFYEVNAGEGEEETPPPFVIRSIKKI